MSIPSSKDAYIAAQRGLAEQLPGASIPWLNQIRSQALEQFADQGFPTTANEDWKYTNVRPIEKAVFSPGMPSQNALSPQQLTSLFIPGLESHRIVFINGHFAREYSDDLPSGASFQNLSSVRATDIDKLESVLAQVSPREGHGFTALNTAFLHDAAWLEISKDSIIDKPIELIFIAAGEGVLSQPRITIVAGENCKATVVERYVSLAAGSYLTNAVSEIELRKGAQLTHLKLQEEHEAAFHVGGLYVRQQQDSQLIAHSIAYGARLARNDVRCALDAENGKCHLNGLYLGTGRQHVDNHTHIDHNLPSCLSREFYKGILDGRARAVFHGRIVVKPDAQKTDSEQSNQNLLLSRDAEVDTKPQLEIYADDVKCAHGATVGQLDDKAIFYLRSRGIEQTAARDLLTYAFAEEVLNRIDVTPIKQHLEKTLSDRLLHGRQFEGLT